MAKKHLVHTLLFFLPLIILAIIFYKLTVDPSFDDHIRAFGFFGPVIITFYIAFSHILAPISGTPVVLICASLYGIPKTMLITFIGGIISSIVNFHISRIYGRKIVKKLIGEKAMSKVDRIVGYFGIKMLIFSRLFGFTFFDLISYAAGLTVIKFRDYFITTFICSSIPLLIFGFISQNSDISFQNMIVLFLGAIFIVGLFYMLSTRYIFDGKRNYNK